MKTTRIQVLILTAILLLLTFNGFAQTWHKQPSGILTIYYTSADKAALPEYEKLLTTGCNTVEKFFGKAYKQPFDVFIYPMRSALDSSMSIELKIPHFNSECWMVASGVAKKIDILSPGRWSSEACEHIYSDTIRTRNLFTHELVHVFHGQLNASPDFSDVTDIDWFIEGLATYASGQCDAKRIRDVQDYIQNDTLPASLDGFWIGKQKYGLAGTMVMFIDTTYGHAKLMELIPFNRKEQIMQALATNDTTLISGWKKYMKEYASR